MDRMSRPLPDPDRDLQAFEDIHDYLHHGVIPWRHRDSGVKEYLRACDQKMHDNNHSFPLRDTITIPSKDFYKNISKRFSSDICHTAIHHLAQEKPNLSAKKLLSPIQAIILVCAFILMAIVTAFFPMKVFITFNILVTTYFIAIIIFRMFLFYTALKIEAPPSSLTKTNEIPAPLHDDQLPIITILLPLRDEASSLPVLVNALDQIDYPTEKIDVKLLLEEDDIDTQNAARNLGLHETYDVIIVPIAEPRTKPKACNHALYTARGALTVIYDAEDQPEPDQLRKAANAFAHLDDDIICLQARLNYYNANDNWLTRLFSLEYALWFDSLLPALEKMRIPIPLGGTSNFFRTEKLLELNGWDPYNVTEDADLGLRLSAHGYRTAILDSTTFEEANCDLFNWIRQRSRWMKGYMQTTFVHMRHPGAFISKIGILRYIGMQLFVAGNVFSAIINPALWFIFVLWHTLRPDFIAQAFPGPLLWLNLIALLMGNFFFIYLSLIAPLKRGWAQLSPYGLMAPIYWSLTAVAAYRALWQLIHKPFYWEKTNHQISKSAVERAVTLKQRSTEQNII